MKSIWLLWLFCTATCFCCIAQEGSNWVFGLKAGIDFNSSPAKPLISSVYSLTWNQTSDTSQSHLPQAISDCSGRLMYYVGGDSLVWNREHKLLPSTGLLKQNYQSCFFVQKPGNDSLMYLFQFPIDHNDTSIKPRYTIINNYLDSGRGDIVSPEVAFADSIGSYSGYIKHANGKDYWVIYKPSDFTMHAYLFTKNGLSKKPVISSCKGRRVSSGNYPYLRSSNNGRFIITVSENINAYPPYYIYNFDNSTGKLSNPRVLVPAATTPKIVHYIHFAFSANDSIIYAAFRNPVNWPTWDSNYIYQLHTYDSQPFNNAKIIFRQKYGKGASFSGMQLGSDNRLYIGYKLDSVSPLSCFKYPDVWGTGSEFVSSGLVFSYGYSNKFPCHSYPVKRINPKFSVTAADGCGHDSTRFKFDGDSSFSSAWWYFGDGDSALELPSINTKGQKTWPGVLHQYAKGGSYYVKLAATFGNCGYRQWVGDSVTLKFKPSLSVSLINDSFNCGSHSSSIQYKWKYADSVHLWRADGSDSLLIVKYDSIPDSQFYNHALGSGKYFTKLKAWNSYCSDSIAFSEGIRIEPFVPTYFTVDKKVSCSSATFNFSDTSGYDSVVQNRYWHIHYPSGKDTVVATVNTAWASIYLDEAGKYDVKLVHTTRQGCVDSLEKLQYVSVLSPLSLSMKLTTGYYCDTHDFEADITYRYADSLHVWLGNKDTLFAIVNSSQPATYHCQFTTDTNGVFPFSVKASNAQCSDSTGYIHTVKFDPAPIAAFQTNNPASCGSSSFAFSDTVSNLGVAFSKWYLQNTGSGWDTTISSNQNTLNLTLTDTGKYTVTLTKTNSQGCVDSLSKPDYVWVHPLPEPRILVDGKMVHATGKVDICFGDTAWLTASLTPGPSPKGEGSKYLWSSGDTAKQLSVPMPSPIGGQGAYSVQVWNEWNCYATSETVQLKWLPKLTVNLYKTLDSITAKTNRPVAKYDWYRNNQQLSTNNYQPFLYHADSGTYTVTVTDSNGCTATSSPLKYTAAPLPPEGGRLAWIYPNPTADEFSLEVADNRQPTTITVADMSGRTLLTLNPGQRTFSTAPLAKGMYLLAITLNGQPLYVKLVKE